MSYFDIVLGMNQYVDHGLMAPWSHGPHGPMVPGVVTMYIVIEHKVLL